MFHQVVPQRDGLVLKELFLLSLHLLQARCLVKKVKVLFIYLFISNFLSGIAHSPISSGLPWGPE